MLLLRLLVLALALGATYSETVVTVSPTGPVTTIRDGLLQAAKDTNSRLVILPGRYSGSDNAGLSIPSFRNLTIEGFGATIVCGSGNPFALSAHVEEGARLRVSGLTIEGCTASGATGFELGSIRKDNNPAAILQSLTFQGGSGALFLHAVRVQIEKCVFGNITGQAVVAHTSDVEMDACTFDSNKDSAVCMYGCRGARMVQITRTTFVDHSNFPVLMAYDSGSKLHISFLAFL